MIDRLRAFALSILLTCGTSLALFLFVATDDENDRSSSYTSNADASHYGMLMNSSSSFG